MKVHLLICSGYDTFSGRYNKIIIYTSMFKGGGLLISPLLYTVFALFRSYVFGLFVAFGIRACLICYVYGIGALIHT